MKVSDAARIKVTTFDAAGVENSSDEWVVEVESRFKTRLEELREPYRGEPIEKLIETYIDAWRQGRGTEAFIFEYEKTQLYYSLRDCEATETSSGVYDHERCTHNRLCRNRAMAASLPPELVDAVNRAHQQLAMTEAEVGN